MIKIKVVDARDQTKVVMHYIEPLDPMMTVKAFKIKLCKDAELLKQRKTGCERVRLQVLNGPVLADWSKPLNEYIKTDSVLLFKDLGPQVGWKTVFLVEYAGPILITVLLLAFRKQIYNTNKPLTFTQKVGTAMVLGHYIKRQLETLLVHRFSSETMPLINIFKNSAHYWILFGVCNMYWFLKPEVQTSSKAYNLVLAGFFALFELLNLKTHLVLKNLRKEGSTDRGIPRGWGFNQVSSANYLWEAGAWLSFALLAKVWGSWLFLAFSTGQMLLWALKKHKRYQQEFPDYPKSRKAMFPFVI